MSWVVPASGQIMDYFIFLVTLQLPFIYLFWRFFKSNESRMNTSLRLFKKQIDQTNSLFETLRTIGDKNRENLEKVCQSLEEENSRLKVKVHRYNQFYEERFRQLERCTGISPSVSLTTSAFLKDKDFT